MGGSQKIKEIKKFKSNNSTIKSKKLIKI